MTATLAAPAAPLAVPAPTRRRWEFVALAVLLIGTAAAYLCNLNASGWGNSFYSAAAQAGSVSWKAFFFGSSDAANSITVDKTPASLWPMALSVRLFGLSTFSLLLPEVLMGVGTVALLWATVRRNFGAAAGLIAGLVLAVTPVAALMFRFNNPDALLVLMMVAAVWAMTRALEDGRWRWLVLCGLFVGFGFLAKQLQVLLVVPALALAYLIAGPPRLGTRILQLLAAAAGLVVGAGWWVLVAELWPAGSRPYFGGSQNNSIMELTLGYNGLGRLNGDERGSVGPGGQLPAGGRGFWGESGITRMFDSAQGGQIAWLIPAALVLLAAGLLLRGRAARTDGQRAALVIWGGWLLVTGLVFSYMKGIFHQYYTVALAPAVAVLVGAGAVTLWQHRDRWWVRFAAALALGLTVATAWMLLSRSADFVPWLRWAVLITGIAATIALFLPLPTRAAFTAATAAGVIGLAGPVAYTVDTLATGHEGAIPSAGPRSGGMFGPGGRPPGNARGMMFGGPGMPAQDGFAKRNGANPTACTPTGQGVPPAPNGVPGTRNQGTPGISPRQGGAPGTGNGTPGATGGAPGTGNGSPGAAGGVPGMGNGAAGFCGDGGPGGFRGGPGNLLGASRPTERLATMLEEDADAYTWVAATIGSNSASGYQLATERPVMPIGGFNGSDPFPTLDTFRDYVSAGKIHYFIGGERGPGDNSADSPSAQITAWVKEHFTAQEVDGVTLYDLTQPR
ncbi:4-amino-4-deoxy-L-arabinose transferase-like glycosyltransferase [Nocardia transvalensis]|uniref:4-amino-4-deoxy-L-arabinose transferase-like glycosyltransferase n=1 Tax=Nocardia transvalensis TaxID=37333 RepID=A0A7W9PEI6_9NOCA|nr:glycosyltransferase family 39 protein [Nocardia transvalensis]MBB5914218.1 4-amino-4-deoxy-L-arabinose transferase-like glycosyltransferase [Nocardia transvalensis]